MSLARGRRGAGSFQREPSPGWEQVWKGSTRDDRLHFVDLQGKPEADQAGACFRSEVQVLLPEAQRLPIHSATKPHLKQERDEIVQFPFCFSHRVDQLRTVVLQLPVLITVIGLCGQIEPIGMIPNSFGDAS